MFSFLALLAACGAELQATKSERESTQSIDWQSVLDSLELPDASVPSVVMPDDIRSHPESQFESFELRAVFQGDTGLWSTLSGQLDRLQVGSNSDERSAWTFNSVARARISSGSALSATQTSREELSRVALDLANSTGGQIHIKDTALTLDKVDECRTGIRFSGRDAANEGFSFFANAVSCPESTSSGFLNQWEFSAISFQGTLSGESVAGTLWLTHRWGNVVSLGGAVLLDQIRVQLSDGDTTSWLIASRTKRASGNGPRTVSAFMVGVDGKRETVNVEWEDQIFSTSPVTGLSYPQAVVLKIPSKEVAMTLQPVSKFSEVNDSLGRHWSGGLLVTGTHTGIGFLDFQPLALEE